MCVWQFGLRGFPLLACLTFNVLKSDIDISLRWIAFRYLSLIVRP